MTIHTLAGQTFLQFLSALYCCLSRSLKKDICHMSKAGVFNQAYSDFRLSQNQSTRRRSSSRPENDGQSAARLPSRLDQE